MANLKKLTRLYKTCIINQYCHFLPISWEQDIIMYRIVGFFEVLKFHECMADFSFITNGSAKSSGTAMSTSFLHGVKFHEWSTSVRFTEFTYLKITNYMVLGRLVCMCRPVRLFHQKEILIIKFLN